MLEQWAPEGLSAALVGTLGRDVDWRDARDLRALHYRKSGRDFYLLVNEGEQTLEGGLSLAATGALELWDPLDGSVRAWPGRKVEARTDTWLRLERRQALVLMVDPQGTADSGVELPPVPGEVVAEITGPWTVFDASGQTVSVPCPGDWAQAREWETFSGTLRFVTDLSLPAGQENRQLFLDLGRVGDIAEVVLNGQPVGVRAWAPYVLEVGSACRSGLNSLEVRVTNSMANACDGLQMPSGMMGPVVLREPFWQD